MKREAAVNIPGMENLEENEEQYFENLQKEGNQEVTEVLNKIEENTAIDKKQFEKRISYLRSIKIEDFKNITADLMNDEPSAKEWTKGGKVVHANKTELVGHIIKSRLDGSLLVQYQGAKEPMIVWPSEVVPV